MGKAGDKMNDYISKSALKKYLRDYKWEFALGSDFSKAIEMVDAQPTVDEKEIIRKAFERVVERLEEQKQQSDRIYNELKDSFYLGMIQSSDNAIEICKEEGGIE